MKKEESASRQVISVWLNEIFARMATSLALGYEQKSQEENEIIEIFMGKDGKKGFFDEEGLDKFSLITEKLSVKIKIPKDLSKLLILEGKLVTNENITAVRVEDEDNVYVLEGSLYEMAAACRMYRLAGEVDYERRSQDLYKLFEVAMQTGNNDAFKEALAIASPNVISEFSKIRDNYGNLPLHRMAAAENSSLCREFLKYKKHFDVDAKNSKGRSALLEMFCDSEGLTNTMVEIAYHLINHGGSSEEGLEGVLDYSYSSYQELYDEYRESRISSAEGIIEDFTVKQNFIVGIRGFSQDSKPAAMDFEIEISSKQRPDLDAEYHPLWRVLSNFLTIISRLQKSFSDKEVFEIIKDNNVFESTLEAVRKIKNNSNSEINLNSPYKDNLSIVDLAKRCCFFAKDAKERELMAEALGVEFVPSTSFGVGNGEATHSAKTQQNPPSVISTNPADAKTLSAGVRLWGNGEDPGLY